VQIHPIAEKIPIIQFILSFIDNNNIARTKNTIDNSFIISK
jgi:hypothetical protein